MMTADRGIRWSTALAVLGVAAVAAVASYEHAYDLVQAHGESGWTARMVPLTVDGLIYASSMVMLDSARRKAPVPPLARWLLGLGIAATLAANVAHGLGRGLSLLWTRGLRSRWSARTRCSWCSSTPLRRLRVRRPDRELPALLAAIRCRRRLLRRSRVRWRPGGCPQCGRSAPGCTSGSRVRSGYART